MDGLLCGRRRCGLSSGVDCGGVDCFLVWMGVKWIAFWSGLGRCGLSSGVDGGDVDCLLEWV